MTGAAAGHPTRDDLVLHHYGESDDPAALGAHLAGCPDCRAALDDVRATLGAVEAEEPPERGPGYGAQVWERIEPRLAAEREAASRLPTLGRRLLWGGALAAGLVAAVLLGRYLPRPEVPGPAGEGASAPARERVLLAAVGDHLERSMVVLLELLNAEPRTSLDVSAEQRSAQDLLSANRLYRQTAVRAGEAGVARVLEELERVLVEVASGPSELEPEDVEALRRRIETQGVVFKVRVIGSQIREREKEAVQGPPRVEL